MYHIALLFFIMLYSCSVNQEITTYIPVKETIDTYDLDGKETMVTKNIAMQPKRFINMVTNDTVTVIHHLDNTGFHFYNAVAFENEKRGVIVGGAGLRIRTTTDGGLHWQENRFSKFANYFHSLTLHNDTIFVVGESKYIYRSTDFGKKWEVFDTDILINKQLNTENNDYPKKYTPRYYKIKFYNKTGIIIGDYNKTKKAKPILLKTTDRGVTWQIILTEGLKKDETGISDITILSEKLLYIVTFKGNCYKSTDGGNTWELKYRNIDTPLNSIDFINENEGFIGGMNTTLWYTKSGGKSWEKIPLKLNTHLNLTNICFINNREAVFAMASQNGKVKADLLYNIDTKTKTVKSAFSKKDTTVLFKGEAHGLYKQQNHLYLLDRNNLYQINIENNK